MRRVKELLRLAHELGYSKRQIAVSIRMPKTTVNDYLARAAAAGLRYADVAGMSEAAVEALRTILGDLDDWLQTRSEMSEERNPEVPEETFTWHWNQDRLGLTGFIKGRER